LLQKHLALAIKDKNAKSAVQQSFLVGFHFFAGAHRPILFIHQY
jgi:hypothetical protein